MYSEYNRTSPVVIGTHMGPADLGPGAVGVVGSGNDADLAVPGHEVGVAEAERLTNPNAGLCQQGQQELVAQMCAGPKDRGDLLVGQGARNRLVDRQLHRAGGDEPSLRDVMEEGFVGASANPSPLDETLGELVSAAGLVVIEAE